jgi:hypothetical protein
MIVGVPAIPQRATHPPYSRGLTPTPPYSRGLTPTPPPGDWCATLEAAGPLPGGDVVRFPYSILEIKLGGAKRPGWIKVRRGPAAREGGKLFAAGAGALGRVATTACHLHSFLTCAPLSCGRTATAWSRTCWRAGLWWRRPASQSSCMVMGRLRGDLSGMRQHQAPLIL